MGDVLETADQSRCHLTAPVFNTNYTGNLSELAFQEGTHILHLHICTHMYRIQECPELEAESLPLPTAHPPCKQGSGGEAVLPSFLCTEQHYLALLLNSLITSLYLVISGCLEAIAVVPSILR